MTVLPTVLRTVLLAVPAAGLLAAAVLLWSRRPAAVARLGLARARPRARAGSRWRVPGLPPARTDAPSLRRRLLLAGPAGVLVVAQAPRLDLPPGAAVALAATAVAVVVVGLGRLEPLATRRRRVRMVLDLPLVLELLSAALEAGRPLRSACAAVAEVVPGPLADDLQTVVVAVTLGEPEEEAWRALRSHPVLGAVAVDLARSVSSGTRLVELLRQHGRMARRLRHGELESMAKAVGVRCVLPLTACFLPAFLLIGVVPIIGSVLQAAFR